MAYRETNFLATLVFDENTDIRKQINTEYLFKNRIIDDLEHLVIGKEIKNFVVADDEVINEKLKKQEPPVTPTRKEWIQIPVSEELPKCEQKVLVLVLSRDNTYVITTGMYEDGSMSECDSCWAWEDVDFEKWDDENDCGIIPEGWYEYHEFNPDGVLNYAIYGKVVAWMPLPEGGENK